MGGLHRKTWVLAALLVLALRAIAEEPTPLSLPEAVKMTRANNQPDKAGLADIKATAACVREARAPMLPKITFAENFTVGNNPVFVAKLQQVIRRLRRWAERL
jgi:hypothetical protein